MLRNRRQRHGIRPRQIRDAPVAVGEVLQDMPARRVRQRRNVRLNNRGVHLTIWLSINVS